MIRLWEIVTLSCLETHIVGYKNARVPGLWSALWKRPLAGTEDSLILTDSNEAEGLGLVAFRKQGAAKHHLGLEDAFAARP